MYIPQSRIIQSITNSQVPTVTTIEDHLYNDLQFIRLVIPVGYGMEPLNNFLGSIQVTGADTFTINIDTTRMNPFIPPVDPRQFAQTIPSGEKSSPLTKGVINVAPF